MSAQTLGLQRETSRTPDAHPGWEDARWAALLDRIEHRQPEVGQKFWGPPLWLEVTMTGPDSDLWPAIGERAVAWDWQSSEPCHELADLEAAGATDDELLDVAGRYTIENLILNAVHEIGEWLRFDGRRLFPAHRSGMPTDSDGQGNGGVRLRFAFGPAAPAASAPEPQLVPQLIGRPREAAAASRFTYLPGTTISYEDAGPVIRRWHDGRATATWRSTWSPETIQAATAGRLDAAALVARDVHRAVVLHEADRICGALHIDGAQPWVITATADRPASLSIVVEHDDDPGLAERVQG